MNKEKIIEEVVSYYNEKLQTFGATSQGVDWKSEASQQTRFEQLLKLIPPTSPSFSILDYGCGFGALLPFMEKEWRQGFSFIGYDISPQMISKAQELYGNRLNTSWVNHIESSKTSVDYVVASGIFNVRLTHSESDWMAYILDTLQHLDQLGQKGFAFNMLTGYADEEYMRDDLYYAAPFFFFEYCKKHFSKYVAVLHDYPLYEFTMLVKKF